ncbi:MAG: S8 family serine peptidase [Aeromicrobium sp.]
MTRRVTGTALAAVLTLTGLDAAAVADDVSVEQATAARPVAEQEPDLARGLIVRTTTGSPSSAVLAATDTALGEGIAVAGDDRLVPRISTVDFDEVVDGAAAEAVAAQVERRDDVVWAIPNRLRRIETRAPVTTNDPLFRQQRNLWDTSSSRRGGYSIKAPALWRATKGSPSTVVAVIDTGIVAHPDLAGRTVAGYDFIKNATLARDGDGRDADPTDRGDWNVDGQCPYEGGAASSWHGTFVAGQIAASANNRTGISGVAPNVKVQPIRALGRCGGWDSDILDSITWASGGSVRGVPANPTPAPIVNLSFGGMAPSASERKAACRVYDAIAKAGRARGSVFIAAAGNEGDNANRMIPASCSEYVSVGATSRKGFSSIYSNVGSTVDLSAPGGDTTVDGRKDSILSLGNTGRRRAGSSTYVRYEGTSMAAPQVAGAAALLHGLGFTTPSALRSALYASVSPFRPRSSTYARKRVRIDGETYRADLNCTSGRRKWCGRGLLDLGRVQAPVGTPTVSGTASVGGTLRASAVAWVSAPRGIAQTWRADGAVVGRGPVYRPTAADVGRRLTVTVSPASGVFARIGTTSAPTAVVTAPAA